MSLELEDLKVVALAGGVGGAKLVLGLDRVLKPGNLSVIVNTGDDFEHFGLSISPDLDTICYTLAGIVDPIKGWGLADETYQVSEHLKSLHAPTWFTLGDKDIATHLERTRLLREGWSLSQVTRHYCQLWGIHSWVFPMSDSPARTLVNTKEKGLMSFQEYFVKHQFQPEVLNLVYERPDGTRVPEAALKALETCDLVVISPSNPLLSIAPILNDKDLRNLLESKLVIAVSPIIQGQALKGPAAKLYKELGFEPHAKTVLAAYETFLDAFIYDVLDAPDFENEVFKDIIIHKAQTIMKSESDKIALARTVLELGLQIMEKALR